MNKSRALRCRSSDKRFGHVASHSYPAAQKGQRITRDHGAAHKPAAFHNLALCSEAPTCTEIENAQATRG